jgi:hypothetical protein
MNGLLDHKKTRNSQFSLTAWSQNLGYKNPSYLAQCLKRERTINLKLLKNILESEQPSQSEREFLSFLFLKHNCKDLEGLPIDAIEFKLRQYLSKGDI